MIRVRTMFLLFLSLLSATPVAMADDEYEADEEHRASDEAYESSKSGKILSLVEILKRAMPYIKGEIIETKYEDKDGRPAYEIYFLDSKGRRKEIYVDARTGALLAIGESD